MLVTWLERDDGELVPDYAPIVAWRVHADPDALPEPIPPGMPLDPNSVWAVALGSGMYFPGGTVHGTESGASFAKWQHQMREQRRRQEREYQAKARQRAA